MRIAVLAWGSLVWQPANRHGALLVEGPWRTDGPRFPIEFARISSDGRLTLAVLSGYPHRSTVLWSLSSYSRIGDAVANLARRETRSPPDSIHGVDRVGVSIADPDPEAADTASRWLEGRDDLDAAIWSGLPPGDGWDPCGGFSPDAALAYASQLSGEVRRRTEEYVRRAPPQIDPPLRGPLQQVLSSPPGGPSRPPGRLVR